MKISRLIGFLLAGLLLLMALLISSSGRLLQHLLAERLQTEYQRTLKLEAAARLDFWPDPTLHLPRTTLTEAGSAVPFARLDSAELALGWRPLLAGHIVIERLHVEGGVVSLRRSHDGRLNIDDLLQPRQPAAATPDLLLRSIVLHRLNLDWHDEASGQRLLARDVEFSGGPLATRTASAPGRWQLTGQLTGALPSTPLDFSLDTRAVADLAQQRIELLQPTFNLHHAGGESKMSVARLVAGLAAGGSPGLHLDIEALDLQAQGKDDLYALQLNAPRLGLENGRLAVPVLRATARLAPDAPVASAQLQATLDAELATQQARASFVDSHVELRHARLPGGSLTLPLAGRLALDLPAGAARAELNTRLDGAPLAGQLTAEFVLPFELRRLTAALDIERLDLDRYRASATANAAADTGDGAVPQLTLPFNLDGRLRIGQLQIAGSRMRDLRLAVATRDGQLHIVTLPGKAKIERSANTAH
jgi:hypothetical protein